MIQPVTLLGAGLCLGVLALRYRSRPKDSPPRTREQKLKTAKVVFAALMAWMALSYTLVHITENLDGVKAKDPSLIERIVFYFSK